MIKHKRNSLILWLLGCGFFALIVLSWLDEFYFLPRLAPDRDAHPNWFEAILETITIASIGVVIIFSIRQLIKRMIYLEGFLRVCAWCRKVSVEDRWASVEDHFSNRLATKTSHGMCPECQEKWGKHSLDINHNSKSDENIDR